MKASRQLRFAALAAVALLAASIALVFTPAVQTWAVRRALAARPGLHLEVGGVAAGLNGVKLDNVRMVRPDFELTIPSATIGLPLWSALRGKFYVRRFVARDWLLDFTAGKNPGRVAPVATPAASAAAIFHGVFDRLRLPADLELGSAECSGVVVFPAISGHSPARAQVTLTGGGLAPQREGRFDVRLAAVAGVARAAETVSLQGTLTVAADSHRTFSLLAFEADAVAAGTPARPGGRVHLSAAARRAADGEHYAVTVATVGKNLFVLAADYPNLAPTLRGTWRLDAGDADLAPFAAGRPLPVFAVTGAGGLETDATFNAVRVPGHFHVSVGQPGVVCEELRGMDRLAFDADFDVVQSEAGTRVDRLKVTLTDPAPVAGLGALQAFTFNFRTGELKVADPAADLFSVELKDAPLAWAQPFFSVVRVAGGVTGALRMNVRDGGVHLDTPAQITVQNFSVARADRMLFRLGRVELKLGADYSPQGWQSELTARARDGAKSPLTLQARAGCIAGQAQAVKVVGQIDADLPAVFAQPMFASLAHFTGGRAHAGFQASLGAKREIETSLVLAGLAAPQAPSLPGVAASLRAEFAAGGPITFSAPVALTGPGGKSDFILAGTLRTGAAGLDFDARLTGDFLAWDEVGVFAAAAGGALSGPAAAAGPDAAPFWRGLSGRIALAVKKLDEGNDFFATGLAGELRFAPEAVTLAGFHAGLGGGEVRLGGTAAFSGAAPQPYSLRADVAVNGVDVGTFFSRLDPARPPTIEGRFDGRGRLTGDGINPSDLARRIRIAGSLTSKGGVFRGLACGGGAPAAVPSGGLAAWWGKAKPAAALDQLAAQLQEIPYDQLDLQFEGASSSWVELEDFSLISPRLRLTGAGTLADEPGRTVLARPLELQMRLGLRQDLAALAGEAGKLSAVRDELGYAVLNRPFKITGTPAGPDAGDLYGLLHPENLAGASRFNWRLPDLLGGRK